MIDPNEADRLRALFALMREYGVAKVTTQDGLTVERPTSPLEALTLAAEKEETARNAKTSPDERAELAKIEKEAERSHGLEARWNEYWTRMTASSGAAAPKYPGDDKASRFLGSWT